MVSKYLFVFVLVIVVLFGCGEKKNVSSHDIRLLEDCDLINVKVGRDISNPVYDELTINLLQNRLMRPEKFIAQHKGLECEDKLSMHLCVSSGQIYILCPTHSGFGQGKGVMYFISWHTDIPWQDFRKVSLVKPDDRRGVILHLEN